MSVTRITVSVPAPQLNMLVSNVVGLVGLVAVVLAVGGLTGNWWWSVLAGGAAAVGLAWVAATNAQRAEQDQAAVGDAEVSLRAVPAGRAGPVRGAAAA